MKKVTVFFLAGMILLGTAGVFLMGNYQKRLPGPAVPGNIPTAPESTAAAHVERIEVPRPAGRGTVDLRLKLDAGRLTLGAASQQSLVSGTARYGDPRLKPVVAAAARSVSLVSAMPSPVSLGRNLENEWNLSLDRSEPLALSLETGAVEAALDIGTLNLAELSVRQGAARLGISASAPLSGSLERISVNGGASDLRLSGLGNTGARELVVKSGAGNYDLDFSGSKPGPMSVTIDGGLGNVTIRVPAERSAVLRARLSLTNVGVHGTWVKTGDTWSTPGTVGAGSPITINLSMGAGNVELRN